MRGRLRSVANAAVAGRKPRDTWARYHTARLVQEEVAEEWQGLMNSTGTDATPSATQAAPKSAGRPDLPDDRRHAHPPGFPKFMPPPPPGSAESKYSKTWGRSTGSKSGKSSCGEDHLQRSRENNSDPTPASRPESISFETRLNSTLDEILESEYPGLPEEGYDDEYPEEWEAEDWCDDGDDDAPSASHC